MNEKAATIFIPDFCNIRVLFSVVLVAQLLAFLLQLAAATPNDQFWADLGLKSLFILWITLASSAVLCGLRGRLQKMPEFLVGICAFLVIQLMTLFVSYAAYLLLYPAEPVVSFSTLLHAAPLYLRNIAISSIISAVMLRYLYVQHQWHQHLKAESDARFDALQSRIRPHFLFNSLNTIASLVRTEPETADHLIQGLSELFRASLQTDTKFVSLASELELTKNYLHIESQRLGERLQVKWNLEDLPEDAMLPPLSLQPLVENAVYHGIEPAANGGTIEISGHKIANNKIVLAIANTLPDASTPSLKQGSQMALKNIRARIQNCFSGTGELMIKTCAGEYEVRLVIPYMSQANEATYSG